jgi:pyroglutamyl-peptidase
MGYRQNPAWLATKGLHNTYLSTEKSPKAAKSTDSSASNGGNHHDSMGRRIHIQSIQSAVVYSHILSLVPLIHGNEPSAPSAQPYLDPYGDQPDSTTKSGPQGTGDPYPSGYTLQIPKKGYFDLVVHVGVGSSGAIAVEKLAHKRGYQIPDAKGEKAPYALDQTPTEKRQGQQSSEAEKREMSLYEKEKGAQSSEMKPSSSNGTGLKDPVRGFGEGYENFGEEEVNSNNVTALIQWLKKECGMICVRESHDAGRYLCDYIVSLDCLITKREDD